VVGGGLSDGLTTLVRRCRFVAEAEGWGRNGCVGIISDTCETVYQSSDVILGTVHAPIQMGDVVPVLAAGMS
jgi:hypothetical protein